MTCCNPCTQEGELDLVMPLGGMRKLRNRSPTRKLSPIDQDASTQTIVSAIQTSPQKKWKTRALLEGPVWGLSRLTVHLIPFSFPPGLWLAIPGLFSSFTLRIGQRVRGEWWGFLEGVKIQSWYLEAPLMGKKKKKGLNTFKKKKASAFQAEPPKCQCPRSFWNPIFSELLQSQDLALSFLMLHCNQKSYKQVKQQL